MIVHLCNMATTTPSRTFESSLQIRQELLL